MHTYPRELTTTSIDIYLNVINYNGWNLEERENEKKKNGWV